MNYCGVENEEEDADGQSKGCFSGAVTVPFRTEVAGTGYITLFFNLWVRVLHTQCARCVSQFKKINKKN